MSPEEIFFTLDDREYRLSIWDNNDIDVDCLYGEHCTRHIVNDEIYPTSFEDEVYLSAKVIGQVNRLLKLRLFL